MLLHWKTAGRLKEHSEAANAVGSYRNTHFLMVSALNAKRYQHFILLWQIKDKNAGYNCRWDKEATFDSK